MSFVTVVSLSCDTDNCKTTPIIGDTRWNAWVAAGQAGWERVKAAETYCPACKALRHPKVEKVAKADTKATKADKPTKVTKAAVAQTKATKAANKPVAKVTKPVAKPVAKPITKAAKVTKAEQPIVGQSIGKLAKSAKK